MHIGIKGRNGIEYAVRYNTNGVPPEVLGRIVEKFGPNDIEGREEFKREHPELVPVYVYGPTKDYRTMTGDLKRVYFVSQNCSRNEFKRRVRIKEEDILG
ncbi:MAG: hypothetical protein AB1468_03080 [Candidatus Micrarchaeota archaeon]